jgi:probable HAF family extracellular repeat protein
MKKTAAVLVTILIAVLSINLSRSVAAENYVITDLGTLGGSQCLAYAINDPGQIVGDSWHQGDAAGGPFLYTKAAMIDLDAVYGIGPGYYGSMAEDINNLGQIVGNSSAGHAVVLWKGETTDLGTFGGAYSSALGINNLGQVVGYYAAPYGYHHAFSYSNGVITELGPFGVEAISVAYAVNDFGMIVGIAADSYKEPSHAFLYSNGIMTDISPFGNSESYARDINNHGQVVGEFLTADATGFHCFLYNEGRITDLRTLGGPDCAALAINEQGDVVGTSPVQTGTKVYCDDVTEPETCHEYPVYSQHGFVYRNGKMTDLNTLIAPDSGWELQWANDINNRGQIVGYGTLNGVESDYRAFLLTPIRTTR